MYLSEVTNISVLDLEEIVRLNLLYKIVEILERGRWIRDKEIPDGRTLRIQAIRENGRWAAVPPVTQTGSDSETRHHSAQGTFLMTSFHQSVAVTHLKRQTFPSLSCLGRSPRLRDWHDAKRSFFLCSRHGVPFSHIRHWPDHSFHPSKFPQNDKTRELEIRKRFEFAKTNSLGHWVTPKDLQIHRYRNYIVPVLPRTRPLAEAAASSR